MRSLLFSNTFFLHRAHKLLICLFSLASHLDALTLSSIYIYICEMYEHSVASTYAYCTIFVHHELELSQRASNYHLQAFGRRTERPLLFPLYYLLFMFLAPGPLFEEANRERDEKLIYKKSTMASAETREAVILVEETRRRKLHREQRMAS